MQQKLSYLLDFLTIFCFRKTVSFSLCGDTICKSKLDSNPGRLVLSPISPRSQGFIQCPSPIKLAKRWIQTLLIGCLKSRVHFQPIWLVKLTQQVTPIGSGLGLIFSNSFSGLFCLSDSCSQISPPLTYEAAGIRTQSRKSPTRGLPTITRSL
jgi:hypothetical protein